MVAIAEKRVEAIMAGLDNQSITLPRQGVAITDFVIRASWVPSTEAVEDMMVQLKTYDAEMGRTGGGVFNVSSRSGTNQFHGSGFYQTRPVWGVNENFFV